MGQPCELVILSIRTGKPVDTLIDEALERYAGQKRQKELAARDLNISRQALYDRLRKRNPLQPATSERPS